MNDETFRDELVTFSLQSDGGGGGVGGGAIADVFSSAADANGGLAKDEAPAVDPLHRPRLLPIVIRLVYGRLAGSGSRGRAGGHGGPAARRAAVLAFLSGLSSEELAELFALMVRPFLEPTPSTVVATLGSRVELAEDKEKTDDGPAEWDEASGGAEQARAVLERVASVSSGHLGGVSGSRQAGFLKMVKEVAKQLGQRALPYVEGILGLVLALLEHSNVVSEAERRERESQDRSEHFVSEGREGEDEEQDGVEAMEEDGQPLSVTTEDPMLSAEAGARKRMAPGALRALCLRALSELFSQFSSTFDFAVQQHTLWPALANPIARLPGSTIGANRAPALLTLASTLTEHQALLPMLSSASGGGGEALVPAVMDCISAGSAGGRVAGPAVVGAALTFVERLLMYDGGSLLAPYLNRLISNFAARLSVTGTSGKGHGGAGGLDSHTEQALVILARVAEMATSGNLGTRGDGDDGSSGSCSSSEQVVDASSMSQLITLLMPALQPDRRASDEAKSSVLRTVSALARRVDSAGARRAWPALSRLLGPAGARPSGMAAAGPRGELVRALEAVASRSDLAVSAGPAVAFVANLSARDAVALDEPDFAKAVPAYNSLSEGTGWEDVVTAGAKSDNTSLATDATCIGGALAATPVAQHCFHAMHEQEVALRGAAGAALKRLVREVAVREREAAAALAAGGGVGDVRCPWEGLMRTVVMPGMRAGMACRTEAVRKGYISLLRETVSVYQVDGGVVQSASCGSSSVVPSDLWILARDDDPESDFFLNACHMQVHRRARALAKARKVIEDSEAEATAAAGAVTADGGDMITPAAITAMAVEGEDERPVPQPSCPFRVSTLVHFLLPLAIHPLHEAAKSAEAGLVGQAIQLVGALARHLPWTHYNAALRNLMQQVASSGSGAGTGSGLGGKSDSSSDSPEKERAMVSAMCEVLDAFHFALVPPSSPEAILGDSGRSRGSGGSGGSPPSTMNTLGQDSRTSTEEGGGDARQADTDAIGAREAVAPAVDAMRTVVGATGVAGEAGESAETGSNIAGDAVWRAVNGRLLGSLRSMLTKHVRSKAGGTEKVLRAPVALGMLTLVRRLPQEEFALQLQPLLMAVCQSLKSRDSNARDTARDTLAKMARTLGTDYLQQVCDAVNDGYRMWSALA